MDNELNNTPSPDGMDEEADKAVKEAGKVFHEPPEPKDEDVPEEEEDDNDVYEGDVDKFGAMAAWPIDSPSPTEPLTISLGPPMKGTTNTDFHTLFATEKGRVGFRCLDTFGLSGGHRIRLELVDEHDYHVIKHVVNMEGWKFDSLPRTSIVTSSPKEFSKAIQQAMQALLVLVGPAQAHAVEMIQQSEPPVEYIINWTEKKIFSQSRKESGETLSFLEQVSADNFSVLNEIPKSKTFSKF